MLYCECLISAPHTASPSRCSAQLAAAVRDRAVGEVRLTEGARVARPGLARGARGVAWKAFRRGVQARIRTVEAAGLRIVAVAARRVWKAAGDAWRVLERLRMVEGEQKVFLVQRRPVPHVAGTGAGSNGASAACSRVGGARTGVGAVVRAGPCTVTTFYDPKYPISIYHIQYERPNGLPY
jgi:hypothetical protein